MVLLNGRRKTKNCFGDKDVMFNITLRYQMNLKFKVSQGTRLAESRHAGMDFLVAKQSIREKSSTEHMRITCTGKTGSMVL